MLSSIRILYSSQTGNAEFIASHVSHEAVERGYTAPAPVTLDEFTLEEGECANALFIFVTSTTGYTSIYILISSSAVMEIRRTIQQSIGEAFVGLQRKNWISYILVESMRCSGSETRIIQYSMVLL